MKAIIIGGGIGGLCAAIGLNRVGVRSAIFEQADQLREVGAGLTLWINATRALERLGATGDLLECGSAVARFEERSWRGDVLSVLPLARLGMKLGAPVSTCVHRGEFLKQLARQIDPKNIHCYARCTGFEGDDIGVTVRFADGREERGDVLVGADGLHSVVRARLHGESKPRYAGYTCWRGLARFEHKGLPSDAAFEAMGPGKRFAAHHCGKGRVFWYGTKNTPEGMADAPGGRKAEAQECFRDWFSPIPELIEATPPDGILRNDIVDRMPIRSWGKGRVTLLGDAAHPTTPNLGQGACQAIEDAVTLAHCLGQGDNAPSLLRSYESRRIPRTTMITNQSLRVGIFGQFENPLACALRDTVTRITPSAVSLTFMENVLSHDLPDLR
jgi:2-polyprenyl-6-methoxyphenol hydroxylase-like FAD-dependent oxidoreductase